MDGSADMLDAARRRLRPQENQSYVKASFRELLAADPLDEYFYFIHCSLAIHHLTFAEKQALYSYIHKRLSSGGCFVHYDVVLSPSEQLEDWYLSLWRKWIDDRADEEKRDELLGVPEQYQRDPRWLRELDAVSHRPYGTGFLFGDEDAFVNSEDSHYLRDCDFVGLVREQDESGSWLVEGRNRFQAGDRIELIGPEMRQTELVFAEATSKAGEVVTTVQPNALVRMMLPEGTQPGDFLRRWR